VLKYSTKILFMQEEFKNNFEGKVRCRREAAADGVRAAARKAAGFARGRARDRSGNPAEKRRRRFLRSWSG
jgi:hypothetical protein